MPIQDRKAVISVTKETIMPTILDVDIALRVEEWIKAHGVTVIKNFKSGELHGKDFVQKLLGDGVEVKCDLMVLATKVKPNTELACKMGIQIGVDISIKLLEKAKKRGILSVLADASNLPFKSNSFDEAYLIFTICFLTKAEKALIEAKRTLKKNGKLIIAFIPKESPLGMKYLEKAKNGHPFYSKAKFYSFKEILKLASKHGFELERIVSALGPKIEDLTDRYDPKYSFCCIKLKRKQ